MSRIGLFQIQKGGRRKHRDAVLREILCVSRDDVIRIAVDRRVELHGVFEIGDRRRNGPVQKMCREVDWRKQIPKITDLAPERSGRGKSAQHIRDRAEGNGGHDAFRFALFAEGKDPAGIFDERFTRKFLKVLS